MIGYVVNWQPANSSANGVITAVLDDPTKPFTNTSIITGQTFGSVLSLNQASRPWYQLNIESIQHSITGKGGEAVGLEFQAASGGANTTSAIILHGESYIGKNSTIATRIPNPQANTDPNIYISTYGFILDSSFSITLEIGKGAGYAWPVEG